MRQPLWIIVRRCLDWAAGAGGLVGACLVLPLTGVMIYEVVLRFAFDLPTFWAYEFAWMLTGAHFALGIGYVLREGQHVRVDFLYARLSMRAKALVDGLTHALFIAPVSSWLTVWLGIKAWQSFRLGEVSGDSAWNPVVWPLNLCVFLGFALFSAQSLAEILRSIERLMAGPGSEAGRNEHDNP